MKWIIGLVLALLVWLAFPSGVEPVKAQGCGPQNPNCIVPTRPPGDSTNAAASTAFVQGAVGGVTPTCQPFTNNAAGCVPNPSGIAGTNFLSASGTWAVPSVVCSPFSTSGTASGCVAGSNGVGAAFFLNANGTWSVPAGGGGGTLAVGSTGITGGATTQILFDNAGLLGEYTAATFLSSFIGTKASNLILAGPCTGAAAVPTWRAMCSQDLDQFAGTTRGSLLERNATTWAGLVPGATPNMVLVSPTSTSDPTWTTATSWFNAFCGSTIGQVWVQLSGGWGCTVLGYANPVWWGADPTGANAATTTAAFNSAVATGLPIFWPKGTFSLNAAISVSLPNASACFCMFGTGPMSKLIWTVAGGGITVTANNRQNYVNIHDMWLSTTQVNSGTALNFVGYNPGTNFPGPTSTIERVMLSGDDFNGLPNAHYWATGILITLWSNWNLYGVQSFGPIITGGSGGGTGIEINGSPASSLYTIIVNILNSVTSFQTVGIKLDSFWQGVLIQGHECNGGTLAGGPCIQQSASATGTLSWLQIVNSQMNTGGNQINLLTPVASILVAHNTITCAVASCYGLFLGGSVVSLVQDNFFNLSGTPLPANTVAIQGSGATGTITGNIIQNYSLGIDPVGGPIDQNWAITGNALVQTGTIAGTGIGIALQSRSNTAIGNTMQGYGIALSLHDTNTSNNVVSMNTYVTNGVNISNTCGAGSTPCTNNWLGTQTTAGNMTGVSP